MLLWARIADPHNGYQILAAAGTPELHEEMLRRIGWLRLFNPFWPERGNLASGEWLFDLEVSEQRAVASILLSLGTSGTDGRVLKPVYKKSDSKKDKERRLSQEQLAEMAASGGGDSLLPDHGTLRFTYDMEGEECREDVNKRRAVAQDRLGWKLPPLQASN